MCDFNCQYLYKQRIWYQHHRICYKRKINGMHNFHFSLSLYLIWDTILEAGCFAVCFFFFKREILALAVVLTWVPYFYSKSVIVNCMHMLLSFTGLLFFNISRYLLFSCFCFRFSFVSELLLPVISYLSSTALITQESTENQQMYITYISTTPAKQCLDFDT